MAGAPLVANSFAKGAKEPLTLRHLVQVPPKVNPETPDVFAVVMIHKRQFKVVKDDLVMTARMPDVDIGTIITLDKVSCV